MKLFKRIKNEITGRKEAWKWLCAYATQIEKLDYYDNLILSRGGATFLLTNGIKKLIAKRCERYGKIADVSESNGYILIIKEDFCNENH